MRDRRERIGAPLALSPGRAGQGGSNRIGPKPDAADPRLCRPLRIKRGLRRPPAVSDRTPDEKFPCGTLSSGHSRRRIVIRLRNSLRNVSEDPETTREICLQRASKTLFVSTRTPGPIVEDTEIFLM